jgi:hypothetical protein
MRYTCFSLIMRLRRVPAQWNKELNYADHRA